MMPMFSSDGKHIVYNDYGGDAGAAAGHTLTVMDFDVASKTFSNGRQVFTDASKYPGWPFFTPDGNQVVFTLGNAHELRQRPDAARPGSERCAALHVDVATKMAHRLDMASGYNGGGTEYLPFPGRDENLDFFPTVNPISAGGYYWAYFTSRRSYGNAVLRDQPPGSVDVGSKSIWVAAIDINPTPGTDSSHPAFYLPGQELGSGNIRAFAVLAPCMGDGSGCESGIDCCGGSCTIGQVRRAAGVRGHERQVHARRCRAATRPTCASAATAPSRPRSNSLAGRVRVARSGPSRGARRARAARHLQRRLCSRSLATSAVHPVWARAPRPSPVSPWKYS